MMARCWFSTAVLKRAAAQLGAGIAGLFGLAEMGNPNPDGQHPPGGQGFDHPRESVGLNATTQILTTIFSMAGPLIN